MRPVFANRALWGIVAAVIAACIIIFFTDTERRSALLRGDFPAFYSLAVIATTEPASLYNFEKQREVQNHFWPSLDGKFLIASYPPYTAWLLKPLAQFSAGTAKLIFTSLMLLALIASAQLTKQLNPALAGQAFSPTLLLVCWAPLATAVLGGQNISLSLLLLVGTIYLLQPERNSEVLAGVLLGIWCFKPQYGLPMLFATIALGRPRVLWGAIPVCLFYYLAAYQLLGANWFTLWTASSVQFAKLNLETNGYQIISIIAGAREFSRVFTGNPDGPLAVVFGVTLSLGVAVALLRTLAQQREAARLTHGLPLIAAALTLLTPQTTYYDIGLFSILLLLLTPQRFTHRHWMGLILVSIAVQLARDYTSLPLFFILALSLLGVAMRAIKLRTNSPFDAP